MRAVVLLVVVVSLLAPPAAADTFYYLVRQWPFTFCNGNANCVYHPTKERFTVHGLWKNFDTGRWPSFCSHERFDAAQLAPLRPALDAQWPSYYGPSEKFWAHEWTKHGTCAEDLFPREVAFFNATLRLHAENSLERALLLAGIRPDAQIRYTSADIVAAVESHLGVQPLVHCVSGKVSEIWMCVNERLEMEDCDQACPGKGCHNANCAHPMLFPPHTIAASAEQ
mmetsp:Transcript_4652/g.13381  ORF Transcript_4652/g.13381 Transcript_4652/m.13381 type:complete len:225 (+) Transcript_4652:164-838(+)